MSRRNTPEQQAEAAARHRALVGRRERDASAQAANIGVVPLIKNVERRERCQRSLLEFIQTYFPNIATREYGDAQKRAIARIQHAVENGGRFINAFPRGFSKSTISELSVLWGILYGFRSYILFVGATGDDTKAAIESIKTELEENDLLAEDFSEVTHAIKQLEGKHQRCKGQTHSGLFKEGGKEVEAYRTHVEWTSNTIVMPSIKVPSNWGKVPNSELDWGNMVPSPASGAIVKVKGITSASRGLRHKRPDGHQARPDLVICDDIETEESAVSPTQVDKRLNILFKSLLRLGGHGKSVSCIVNCTIIADCCVADQLCDAEKYGSFESERIKMLQEMPIESAMEKHWLGEYANIRNNFNRLVPGSREDALKACRDYYIANREEMDEGAVASWPDIPLEKFEVSAIAHAMNIFIDDGEAVFLSECQNEPARVQEAGIISLDVKDFEGRTNNVGHRVVPKECHTVVAAIDVHANILIYTVLAVGDNFTGAVIDYGTYPKQKAAVWTQPRAKDTLERQYGLSQDENIREGLSDLIQLLGSTPYVTQGGEALFIKRGLVDIGYKPDIVKDVIAGTHWMGVSGVGIGPEKTPMPEYDLSKKRVKDYGWPGNVRWIYPAYATFPFVNADVNFWKSFVYQRFTTPSGQPGGFHLYGNHRTNHRLYSQHLVGEKATLKSANGRTVAVWKEVKVGRDNHFFDTLGYCCVAASMEDGITYPGYVPPAPKKARVKRSIADMKKNAKHYGPGMAR